MTNATEPTFSIIVPTLNRPGGLQRAVESVKRQTCQDFELIVVDDGSCSDYAQAVCDTSGLRARVVRNSRNLGAGGARNAGLHLSRGRYVSFLDDDDEYGPDFLRASLAVMAATPESVVMCWCSVRWVDDVSDEGARWCTRTFPSQHASRTALFEDLMSIGTGFGVTLKADFLRRRECFDTDLRTVEDADLFLRIIASGRLPIVVPGVHVTVHNHGDSRLTDARMNELRIRECRLLLSRYRDVFDVYPSLKAQLEHQIHHLHKEVAVHDVAP